MGFGLLWVGTIYILAPFVCRFWGGLLGSGGFTVVVWFVGARRVWWFWCLVLVCGFGFFGLVGLRYLLGLWYLLGVAVFWVDSDFWVCCGLACYNFRCYGLGFVARVICGVVSLLGFGWVCGWAGWVWTWWWGIVGFVGLLILIATLCLQLLVWVCGGISGCDVFRLLFWVGL